MGARPELSFSLEQKKERGELLVKNRGKDGSDQKS